MDGQQQPKRRKLSPVSYKDLPTDCWGIVFTYLLDFEKAILSACSKHLRWILHSHAGLYGPILYHPRSVFGSTWISKPINRYEHRLGNTTNGVVLSAEELPVHRGKTGNKLGFDMSIMSFSQWHGQGVFAVIDTTQCEDCTTGCTLYFKAHNLGGIKTVYIVRKTRLSTKSRAGLSNTFAIPPFKYLNGGGKIFEIYAIMCRGCGDLYNLANVTETVVRSGRRSRVYLGYSEVLATGPWKFANRVGNRNDMFIRCHNCKSRFCKRCSFAFPRAYANVVRMNEVQCLCPFCYVDFESVEDAEQPVGPTDIPSTTTNIADLQREIFELQKLTYKKQCQVQELISI